jgi:glycosyltransferase involved in cell wall biosynthesis
MVNPPKVSVIIPVYNAEKYLARSIESILNQTFQNFEILIIDDGSTDNSWEVIQSFDDHRISSLRNPKNQGVVQSRNKLLSIAKGEYFALQDADDWSEPNRLQVQLDFLESRRDLSICGTQYTKFDNLGNELFVSGFPLEDENIRKNVPEHYQFLCASIMFRKSVYKHIGGYHEFFNRSGNEDIYWIFKALKDYKMVNVSESLYCYRYNPVSITKTYSALNLRKFYVTHLTRHLIKEFYQTGTNFLEEGDSKSLEEMEQKFKAAYLQDPSLIHKEIAGKYMYWKEYQSALKASWKAVRTSPYKIVNYRTLFYCTRMYLINKLINS